MNLSIILLINEKNIYILSSTIVKIELENNTIFALTDKDTNTHYPGNITSAQGI